MEQSNEKEEITITTEEVDTALKGLKDKKKPRTRRDTYNRLEKT